VFIDYLQHLASDLSVTRLVRTNQTDHASRRSATKHWKEAETEQKSRQQYQNRRFRRSAQRRVAQEVG
jgi:hypothetical protein